MNGSRSHPPRQADRTAFDALNRTIEGLEARIEGLMHSSAPDPRRVSPPAAPPRRTDDWAAPAPASDPLAEIRHRQRMIAAGRERALRESTSQTYGQNARRESTASYAREPERPAPARERVAAPAGYPAAPPRADDGLTEIAQALVNLRHDLKRDISEGVSRQIGALREELQDIRTTATDRQGTDDLRADVSRLAESIERLAGRSGQGSGHDMRNELQELRAMIKGMAREDSLRQIEDRWSGVEDRLRDFDANGLQEELVSLAYRLDDIKQGLGGISSSADIRAMEDKLLSIANAMEQFGNAIQPHDKVMTEQFAAVDGRLDEISRAIVAAGRAPPSGDQTALNRLEQRLATLSEQIDRIGQQSAVRHSSGQDDLNARIEMLTRRAEELGTAEATTRLDERLEHLAMMLEQNQRAISRPDLSAALVDISRKIDGIESGSLTDALSERLDDLARRIEVIDAKQAAPALDTMAFKRIEGRLTDIAARLDETTAAAANPVALRNLEDQITHLSTLLSEPRAGSGLPVDLDRRMGAIEDYITTNDEYVVEAARQAAEAVVEAYSRNGQSGGADTVALASLAEDLRHLETLSRSSEERTHETFKALHDTLVQIADRLDHLEGARPAARMPKAEVAFHVDPYATASLGEHRQAAAQGGVQVAERSAASSQTSALAIEAATNAAATPKLSKGSLLTSLGKRLVPGRKKEAADGKAPGERPMIDQAPSIDPVDFIPAEAANELLEPGSGTPDVRKILERVRASQNAARDQDAGANQGSRADYIAAARRAAQAAAMEADPSLKGSAKMRDKIRPGARSGVFARFRRPIILAAGAILLAIVAFPLGRAFLEGNSAPSQDVSVLSSVTGGETQPEKAPQPQTAPAETAQAPASAPSSASESDPQPAPVEVASTEAQRPAEPAPQRPVEQTRLIDQPPVNNVVVTRVSPDNPLQDTSAFKAPAPAPTQPGVSVPDAVQPVALADAARSGDPLAYFEIGARYSEGRNGVTADAKEALRWYGLAAEKDFAPALYRLGSMYEKGMGIERDINKARDLYTRAAEAGNANAMHNLAVLYASGALGEQDYAKAAQWFSKAADLGVADSQFNLAILAARGNGVAQDLTESYKWFSIAAKAGDQDAAAKRDEVARALKPELLDKAKAKVETWKVQEPEARSNSITVPDAWTSGAATKTSSIDMKKAIRNIQAILNNNGFDAGKPDGEMGAKTVTALKSFQKSVGLEASGRVDDATVRALLDRNKPAPTKA